MNEDNGFPYKSIDEIKEEKEHRAVVRKRSVLVAAVLLCAILVVVGVGIWFGGMPLDWSYAEESFDSQISSQSKNGHNPPDFRFEQREMPENAESLLTVTDVSRVVEKCLDGVVGITVEVYKSFSAVSSGSGIILDKNGYIVTNNHVISGGESVSVTLNDGRVFPAYIVGSDEYTDIAVIKIEADNLKPADFGDSDKIRIGETAVAIGNPTGQLMGTVTSGIISALSRNIWVNNNLMTLIQTDASINSGNSGGPLINRYGQVVGINSAKLSSADYEGIGFAIPINTVKPIVEELILQGYVSGRPIVGANVSEVSVMASAFYGIPQGLFVNKSLSASLQRGDVIIGVNGERISNLSSAISIRNTFKPQEKMTLSVYRQGVNVQIEVSLSEQNTENTDYNF